MTMRIVEKFVCVLIKFVFLIIYVCERIFCHRLMDTMGGIISQMPFLRFIIPELSGYNNLMEILRKLWNFLDEEINNHEKHLSGNQPQDLIEAFLLEISSRNGVQNDSIFDSE